MLERFTHSIKKQAANGDAIEWDCFWVLPHTVLCAKPWCLSSGLQDKLQKTTEEANLYEYKLKESNKILDQLKQAVDFLFKQTGCDATKIMEHLGETGEISDQNLMQYFSEWAKQASLQTG